jgi:hypothetical protein
MDQMTANYSSRDWERLTDNWEIRMYTVNPWSGEPVQQGGGSIDPTQEIRAAGERRWDEVADRVLDRRTELWETLAEL